jgi:TatD DNase family protein
MMIDSHCHLTMEPLSQNIEETLQECKENRVEKILTISTDLQTSVDSINLAQKYKNILCAIGIHPNAKLEEFENFREIQKISKLSKKIIGIGETGLDYSRDNKMAVLQIDSFKKHIDLAEKLNIPVIVHTRDAEDETLKIISESKKKSNVRFLIHCFTGSLDFSKKLLDLDCLISFSGIITFKNSHDLKNVIKSIPLNKILIETDSPFLSPEPFRGKSNKPSMLKYVAETVSLIKGVSVDDVEGATTENFNNFFNQI